MDVWAVHQQRRIWHPVVTLYQHDLTLSSSFGNDHHAYRGPSVTWADSDVPEICGVMPWCGMVRHG